MFDKPVNIRHDPRAPTDLLWENQRRNVNWKLTSKRVTLCILLGFVQFWLYFNVMFRMLKRVQNATDIIPAPDRCDRYIEMYAHMENGAEVFQEKAKSDYVTFNKHFDKSYDRS